jgi:hypothetical protein
MYYSHVEYIKIKSTEHLKRQQMISENTLKVSQTSKSSETHHVLHTQLTG